MVKNIYLNTKIVLNCEKVELHLHLEVALDLVVGIVVGVHLTFLKSVLINSEWSKTYIWTKIILLYCQEAELHFEVVQDLFVCIVFGVGVHLIILSLFKSTQHDYSVWNNTVISWFLGFLYSIKNH